MKKILNCSAMLLATSCLLPATMNAQGWNELGTGSNALNVSYPINALCADAAGNIYAAGFFKTSQGNFNVAKWNGTSWTMLGNGVANYTQSNDFWGITALAADGNGNIYATGDIMDSEGYPAVAKWDGSSWSYLSYSEHQGNSFAVCTDASNNIYAGSGGGQGSTVFMKDGAALNGIGACNAASAGYVHTLTTDAAGHLYATGDMSSNQSYRYVAKWTGGTSWQELGTGANALNADNNILALTTGANGNVYAAGAFKNAAFKHYVARWNGTTWSQLGDFTTIATNGQDIYALVEDNNGDIVAAGDFYLLDYVHKGVVKWNGTSWSQVGDELPANYTIKAMVKDPAGNLYIAGTLQNASGKYYVAKYSYTALVTGVQVHTQNNVPAVITQNGGTLQLSANVLPANAVQNVTWSSSYSGNSLPGTVSATGLVTAESDGALWVKATSTEDPTKADSVKIIISNQETSVTDKALQAAGLKLYPNPATESITVETGSTKKLRSAFTIMDIRGNVVLSQTTTSNKAVLDIKNLPSGIYVLKLQNDEGSITRNFTKL